MELNKLVFGGLALACLGAAAAGGYLAAGPRTNTDTEMTSATAAPATGVVSPGQPVAESEGVIGPEAAAPTPALVETPAVSAPRESSPRRVAPAPGRRSQPSAPASRPARAAARPDPVEGRSARSDAPSRTADSASNPTASNSGSMWETRPAVEPERMPVDTEPEPPAAPEAVELVVPADAVLGLQIERTVTSELARVEDRVEARVTRDVRVGDRVAIPAGSVVQGSVMEVERGGKVKERARLGIRFHTVVLADGSRVSIRTDSVVREGASPTKESAAKIGGAAVGGAILGAILGGGKGAVIGGSVGAAGGTAATMAGGRNAAVLPAGTTVSVRVQQPVTVTVEK